MLRLYGNPTVLKFIVFYFRFIFDAMHAVTGAYAKPIFVDKLGASLVWSSTPPLNSYKRTEKNISLYYFMRRIDKSSSNLFYPDKFTNTLST